jgi:hypothetical protein
VVVAILIIVLAACAALVVSAWRLGGKRVGLWTLGLVLMGLGLGFTGFVLASAEVICEAEECPSSAWDVIAGAGSALSLLAAALLALRATVRDGER